MPACPVNGPALSARGKQVAIAWFNAKDDRPKSFVALSSDSGRSFALGWLGIAAADTRDWHSTVRN